MEADSKAATNDWGYAIIPFLAQLATSALYAPYLEISWLIMNLAACDGPSIAARPTAATASKSFWNLRL